jgi:hypothetical protein
MSNQPYGSSHEEYDAYQRQPGYQDPGHQQPSASWQGFDEAQAAPMPQYTQQWEGQTWETQVQPPVAAVDGTETEYPPPQTYGRPAPPGAAEPQPHQHPQPHHQHQQPHQHPQPHHQHQQAQSFSPLPSGAAAAYAVDEPAYGPPTVTGSARVTDAQRARAEGRSPVIEPGTQPALITALLGVLFSVTAAIGQYALLVPLVILQAVTAAGWFRLNGMWPARQGIALAFAGALTADLVLLAVGRENAPAAILGALGAWVLLALVLGLRSHADPDERMYGLMATVASAALAIVATGHLAAEQEAVTVGAVAVAVAIVARALPLPTVVSVLVALVVGAGAGAAVGGMTSLGTRGALLGLGTAVCALIGHRVAAYDYPSRFVHMTAGVALPLTAAAPAVYLLGRALG